MYLYVRGHVLCQMVQGRQVAIYTYYIFILISTLLDWSLSHETAWRKSSASFTIVGQCFCHLGLVSMKLRNERGQLAS